MCSFITQHNATDVASFEGVCNWDADCRNVHQSCCLWIECSFLYHKPSPKAFQRIWQYIQPALQLQTTCTTPAQDLHIRIFTSKIVWDQPPGQLLQQSVCITKEFLHKLSETVSGKLICMLVVLIGVSTWLQFVVVTDLSGQMLTFDGIWHFGEVFLFKDESRFSLYRADGRQCVWRRVGERFAKVSTLWTSGPWWRWGYGMGRRMLWTTNTGAFYWWHFECTEIPWWDPEAHCCAIHPRPSPYVAAWKCTAPCCKDLYTIPGS